MRQPSVGTPAADLGIDAALVTALLAEQHPDLAALPLRPLDEGWDNAMFRLGEHHVVRLPRRSVAAALVANEQRWLPTLATRLPLPIPAPERVGRPGCGYPWSWSVLPWLPGEPADRAPPQGDAGSVLGRFLHALHTRAPAEAPHNPHRGVPLANRAGVVGPRLERLRARTALDIDRIETIWEQGLAAPAATDACWIHGDLHARNVLVDGGTLCAIIDWGDVCAGDPATDLAALWMVLDSAAARDAAMHAYGAPAAVWQRARGWAVSFGSVLLETGLEDHPRHAALGARILERLTR